MLMIDEEIRGLILNKASAEEVKEAAVKQGMRTLWDDGCEKIAAGLTSPEEVIRVVGEQIKQVNPGDELSPRTSTKPKGDRGKS